MVIPTLLCLSCGQVYRPVVIPCSAGTGVPGCPVESPPSPANFHAVFGISDNVPSGVGGNLPSYTSGAMQIDVSGDSIFAETPPSDAKFGTYPTHAAIFPNNTRLFVANAGSVSGGIDAVASFSPAFQSATATGFGPDLAIALPNQTSNITAISEAGNQVTVTLSTPLTNVSAGYAIVIAGVVIPPCSPPPCTSLPQNAYDGGYTITSINGAGTTITYTDSMSGLSALSSGGAATFPPQPVFLDSTQNTAMYVANYNSNSVSAINTTTNSVINTATVGAHPISLAETANALKIYVANQGDSANPNGSVSSLNVATLTSNAVTGFTGVNPVWVVARSDSQKVYVLTQGDGQLVTIDVATDTVTSSLSVGAGANFVFYDPHLNRLYVTNPNAVTATNPLGSMVYVFSATGGATDTPVLLKAISFNAGSPQCLLGCLPTSVTALLDGSRFYVASYEVFAPPATCPDSTVTAPCVVPGLTVFDANSLTPKITPAIELLTWPPPMTPPAPWPFATNQYALPPAATCGPVPPTPTALYSPGSTRFRVFTVASVDSSRVYVSMCDAGAIAVINTTDNNVNNGGTGIQADTLITDLLAAFGNGPTQSWGEPASQNPVFMLTGQ